jgi:hypothetical protein
MTLSRMGLTAPLSLDDTQHNLYTERRIFFYAECSYAVYGYAECSYAVYCYTECSYAVYCYVEFLMLFIFMLSVVILIVVMLGVMALSCRIFDSFGNPALRG